MKKKCFSLIASYSIIAHNVYTAHKKTQQKNTDTPSKHHHITTEKLHLDLGSRR